MHSEWKDTPSRGSAEDINLEVKAFESIMDKIVASVISEKALKETEDSNGISLKITNPTTCAWLDLNQEDEDDDNDSSGSRSRNILFSDDEVEMPQEQAVESNDATRDCNDTSKSCKDGPANSCEKETPTRKKLEKRLQCQHCNKRFALVKRYQDHKCKKIKCTQCDFESVNPLVMRDHKKANHKRAKPKNKETVKKTPVVDDKEKPPGDKNRVDTIRGELKINPSLIGQKTVKRKQIVSLKCLHP